MSSRYILLATLLAVFLLPLSIAPAHAAGEPATEQSVKAKEDFVRGMANTTLAILQDQKKEYKERRVVLRQAFAKVVDIDWIAKFVLGRPWNSATEEQRARFTELYRSYLTESYVSNFGEDPKKRISDITIFGVKLDDNDHFTVKTEMRLADAEQLKVDYLVKDTEGKYKVIDIVIENVSLLNTHRAEFSTLAQNKGIDQVIAVLEKKTNTGKPVTLSMNTLQ